MYFITKLPTTEKGHGMIWVRVGRLKKNAYSIAAQENWSMEKLAKTYVKVIFKILGVPLSTVLDNDN